jgi:hypothetical protein
MALKISTFLLLGGLAAFAVPFYFGFKRVAHDKAVNADVLQPLREQPDLPLGKVVPSNNRWKRNAFVAERRVDGNAVLILDDHYRGRDPAYRSPDGVIGDEISSALLCSVPAQAKANAIVVDPAVLSMINRKCSRGS